jgi:hypothetical protein
MPSTATKACGVGSLAKSFCGLLLVTVVGVGLMEVRIEAPEQLRPAKEVKAWAPVTQEDVLSAADVRQWRQEFLWHRNIRKSCPNAWIDDALCARMTQRL